MKTSRRKFLETTVAGSIATIIPGLSSGKENVKEKYVILDEIIEKPVLKTDQFSTPVIIETLELLRYKNT